MRGRTPPRPLGEVADAAVRIFTDKGFRTAGISDISAALGLSHGALYTYADSKQALLYLALMRAVHPDAVDALAIPVAAPPQQQIIEMVDAWAVAQTGFKALTEAVSGASARPAGEELADIVAELYDFVENNRHILTLIAQCAQDLPDLGQWYFVRRRRAMIQALGEYLRGRIAAGDLRPVPDVPVAARFIVESVAWFAMHRHGDPDSAMLGDRASRETVGQLLVAAFLAEPHGINSKHGITSTHGTDSTHGTTP